MRARNFIAEAELFEINMSPGNLKQLASKIDARVGMEFEMIVPNVESDENSESEPDYTNDERVRGWSSIEQFFNDGDYNSRSAVADLNQELFQQYTESDYWQEAENSWWEENEEYYVEQTVEKELGEELWAQAAEQLGNKKFADERDRKNAIQEIYSTLVSDRRDESIENQDEIYDLARDDAMEESEPDHDTGFDRFLRGTYGYMTEIEDRFSHIVTWPYWEMSGDTEVDISTVANDFSPYVNMKVDYSQSYHGAKRRPDTYVVEPDSSLTGDNPGDAGLEFVSPPLTLEQMGTHLEGVREFARDHNCYTNRTTGLHINVSVPNMSLENLDYVKLALLLGDKYVLEQFGRSANTYCKSAMNEILSRAKSNRDQVPGLLDMMKNGLNKMASKMIHSGVTGKYTSINTKDKYIEFRSPGGDWLNQDLDKIVTTMNRFAVALDAAVDPEKYKEEYSKKLYKVIAPEDADDTIKYFAKYAAGAMPKAALKSFLKQAKLEREVKRKPDSGKRYWWHVTVAGSGAGTEVVAANRDEAIDATIAHNSELARYNRGAFTAKVLRPYDGPEASPNNVPVSSTGSYSVISSGTALPLGRYNTEQEAFAAAREFASQRNERVLVRHGLGTTPVEPNEQPRRQDGSMTAPENDPDANYAIIRSSDNAVIVYFTRNTRAEAERSFTQWLASIGITGDTTHPYYLIAVRPRRDPESSQNDAQEQPRRQDGSMTAPESDPDANFAVIRSSDNAVINYFTRNTRVEADQAFTRWLASQGLAGNPSPGYYLIAIRPRRDSESRANDGTWTGRWNIVTDQGQVLHTFGGIGNSQADANAHARQWLERNRRYAQSTTGSLLGLTVVPDRA